MWGVGFASGSNYYEACRKKQKRKLLCPKHDIELLAEVAASGDGQVHPPCHGNRTVQ